jgi:CRISPR system Cascade subunit CasE
MHFSLITPAPGHERDAALEWTRGAYEEHQWLWRFLPAPPGTPRRFLFRRHEVVGMPRFYVVSPEVPVSPTPYWHVNTKRYAPDLATGDRLDFQLRGNPVITTRDSAGRAVRHDVVMQAKKQLLAERGLTSWSDWKTADRPALPDLIRKTCIAWLTARAERLGFELDEATLAVEGYEQHRCKDRGIRFTSIDFSGRLVVTDPRALLVSLYEGVGHSKAFGCGLLLLRSPG